jgi:hypothetical protein
MKVHWLKDKKNKRKAEFKYKEEVESFCLENNLDFHWEKIPHSYWCIEDILEGKDVLISKFAEEKFGIKKYKTTIRSNKALAKKAIEGFLYFENLRPMYEMKSQEERLKVIEDINKKYGTEYSLVDFEA